MAEQAGERTSDGVQRLMDQARWDAVRDDLQRYVVEHLGDPRAVLILDETGFLQKGTRFVGSAAPVPWHRRSHRELPVPRGCPGLPGLRQFPGANLFGPGTVSAPRLGGRSGAPARAAVPEAVEFTTKPQLARKMLECAFAAGVPAAWVTGDSVCGQDRRLRMWLEERGQPFVLEVPCKESLWTCVEEVPRKIRAEQIDPAGWERLCD